MNPIVAPAIIQVLFTLFMLYYMGYTRLQVLQKKELGFKDIALGQKVWPEKAQRISNAFHNQLETPILFYFAVGLCLHFNLQNIFFTSLAWLYLGCRLGHAYVECRTNHLPTRFRWFFIGSGFLLLIWIGISVNLISIYSTKA